MKNTYLYIRFSHEKQAEGSSYDRQLGSAKAFCPTLIEDKEHIFFDSGKSAFHGEQLATGGDLRRFYDKVKSGAVPKGSTLLVEDLDRLSRDGMWKASDKLRELTENGIAVRTLRDGKLYEGTLKFSDAITSLIKQELANEESEKKSGRVADSYRKRYAKARDGKKVKVLLPSWIKWVSDSEYTTKKAEAATVVDIFNMAAAGHSYAAIAKDLNSRDIKPFRNKKKPDALWITASLFALIKNRAVLGEYSPRDGGPAIPNYFPDIVEKAVFDAANGARSERKRDRVTSMSEWRVNVWGKVAVCGLCQRSMHCLPKGKAGHLYLVCSGKMGGACKAMNTRADRSELAFREVLLNAVNADYFTGDQRQDEMKLRELAGQMDTIRQRKDKLVALLDSDPTPEVVTAIKKANSELTVLADAKAVVEQQAVTDTSIERNRAALMAKIDIEGREARMTANALLRSLSITTEIARFDTQVNYVVRQEGKLILKVYDRRGEVVALSYSQATAERMYERGETPELEYNVSLDEILRAKQTEK
jgi:DNA invertase Pin-like site-specific DNA recombinase